MAIVLILWMIRYVHRLIGWMEERLRGMKGKGIGSNADVNIAY